MARTGVLNVKSLHFPYGARRGVPFNSITAKRFTGQYHEASLPGGEGLSFYNARWYDPKLGAFLSADSIVPAPLDPQSPNRYAYAGGNPLRFSDPSGHTKLCGAACEDEYKWSPVTKKGGGSVNYGGGVNVVVQVHLLARFVEDTPVLAPKRSTGARLARFYAKPQHFACLLAGPTLIQ